VPDDIKPRIRLCDTMGFGLPYAGAELPRSIPKLVWRMIHEGGIPSERLEWHGHDDFHKVLVNATTAWLCGCDALNGTMLGIGERTGNPPLEGAVFEYIGIKGRADGLETLVLREIADYFEKEIGYSIPHKEPFVGRDFNKTRAGIHAGGLYRDHRVYNIFDTEKILGVPPSVAITDKSGSDGVAYWVNGFLALKGKDRLGKTKLVKIMRWVEDQYELHGRTTAVSDQEMEELVKEHLPNRYAEVKGTSA
jgi:isopropylmalate/homocitrate/citramalate synthase